MKNKRSIMVIIMLLATVAIMGCGKESKSVDSENSNDALNYNHSDGFMKIGTLNDLESSDGSVGDSEKTLAQKLAEAQNNIDTATKTSNGTADETKGFVAQPVKIDEVNSDTKNPLITYVIDKSRLAEIDYAVLPDEIKNYIFSSLFYDYDVVAPAIVDICVANEIDIESLKIPEHPSTYTDDYTWDIIIIKCNVGEIYLYTMYDLEDFRDSLEKNDETDDAEQIDIDESVDDSGENEDRPDISIKYQIIKK